MFKGKQSASALILSPLIICSVQFLLFNGLFCGVAQADDRKSASDLVRSRGFNVDEFDVISQNYILKVYRIINPLADPKTLHRVPVVGAHGVSFDITNMMAASTRSRPRKPRVNERVTLYAMENGTDDRGLHFYLSNNNYDVWLIESRATNERNSKRITDGTNNKTFWDFSLDEQALIDLPLQLEFIMRKTNSEKVAYIAYSQSTTLMFMLLSMKPEWSEKVVCFVALAPVVYTTHMKGLVWPMTMARTYLQPSSSMPLLPGWLAKFFNTSLSYLCSVSFIKYTYCRAMWWLFTGHDKNIMLDGGLTEGSIKTTSFKAYEQYVHNANIRDFRMYDYKDEQLNGEAYGQPVPPRYNVSKIRLNTIALFRGTNDPLSTTEDQTILMSKLRVPLYEDHVLEDYAHLDFIASPTVTRDINEPILRILDTLTKRPVRHVSHTLGNPNPQVVGTQLEIDVRADDKQASASARQKTEATFMKSQPEQEKPKDGVTNNAAASSVREELSGKLPTRPKRSNQ